MSDLVCGPVTRASSPYATLTVRGVDHASDAEENTTVDAPPGVVAVSVFCRPGSGGALTDTVTVTAAAQGERGGPSKAARFDNVFLRKKAENL